MYSYMKVINWKEKKRLALFVFRQGFQWKKKWSFSTLVSKKVYPIWIQWFYFWRKQKDIRKHSYSMKKSVSNKLMTLVYNHSWTAIANTSQLVLRLVHMVYETDQLLLSLEVSKIQFSIPQLLNCTYSTRLWRWPYFS